MADVKKNIDFDRGVIFATHPQLGLSVYMYVDAPGKYINAFGKEISETLAKEAGFEVERYAKDRRRREMLAKAAQAIDSELESVEEPKAAVVLEKEGFKVLDIGYGRFNVNDPDGNMLNATPLSQELAEKLVERLTEKANA